jgi:hypothetical protein
MWDMINHYSWVATGEALALLATAKAQQGGCWHPWNPPIEPGALTKTTIHIMISYITGWWFGTYLFSIYWEFHHPN